MTHTPAAIARAIQKYIESQSTPVSMEYIITRSTDKGNSMVDTLGALEKLHRVRSIKKLTRKDGVWYQYAEPKKMEIPWAEEAKPLTPEEIAQEQEYEEWSERFWNTCEWVTPQEKICHNKHGEWYQKPNSPLYDICEETMDTPAGFEIAMGRKYGEHKWRRMKEERAIL